MGIITALYTRIFLALEMTVCKEFVKCQAKDICCTSIMMFPCKNSPKFYIYLCDIY
jgi:hypothetical protein